MIKAVLFDMDGVITDTEKYYYECWPKSFHAFGYTDFTPEDALFKRSLNHADTAVWCRSRFGEDIPVDEIRAYNNRLVDALIKERGIQVKPGIRELLAFLEENNIKSAVVTATRYDGAMGRLGQVGLDQAFGRVISAHMVERGKPHPDVYLYACEQIKECPGDCVAIEDSPNGIRAASSAGCRTVMVPDLTQPTEDLLPLLWGTAPTLREVIDLIREDLT